MRDLIILGASGDLTRRYLLPALVALAEGGRLPQGRLVAVARGRLDSAAFGRSIAPELARHCPEASREAVSSVLDRLVYHRGDATQAADLARAIGSGTPIIYLALPPAQFEGTIQALAGLLPDGSRIVIEKPFGQSLDSARSLNQLLHRLLPEQDVFRIDHFLGHQTVQNVVALRFANQVFEPLWNRRHIDRVDIVWDETIALEGRAGYYDRAGALRDMVQNHLLQLLALVAMEAPDSLDEKGLRDAKLDVLRSVGRLGPAEVASRTLRAFYSEGQLADRQVPSYHDEPGVDPSRETETFAEVELSVDNPRWDGVPFRLRSGKALGRDRREIRVTFRNAPELPYPWLRPPGPNSLTISIDPGTIRLDLRVTGQRDAFDLEPAQLSLDLNPAELPAYARLLLDVFDGDSTFMVRDDEVEESWAIVDPILRAWRSGNPALQSYRAGSSGPGRNAAPPLPAH